MTYLRTTLSTCASALVSMALLASAAHGKACENVGEDSNPDITGKYLKVQMRTGDWRVAQYAVPTKFDNRLKGALRFRMRNDNCFFFLQENTQSERYIYKGILGSGDQHPGCDADRWVKVDYTIDIKDKLLHEIERAVESRIAAGGGSGTEFEYVPKEALLWEITGTKKTYTPEYWFKFKIKIVNQGNHLFPSEWEISEVMPDRVCM